MFFSNCFVQIPLFFLIWIWVAQHNNNKIDYLNYELFIIFVILSFSQIEFSNLCAPNLKNVNQFKGCGLSTVQIWIDNFLLRSNYIFIINRNIYFKRTKKNIVKSLVVLVTLFKPNLIDTRYCYTFRENILFFSSNK